MADPEPIGQPPFLRLLDDALGDARDSMTVFPEAGAIPHEWVYEGRRGDVCVVFNGDGSLACVMMERREPGLRPYDDYAVHDFARGESPDPGLATLLAGYLKDDRAATIDGLSLVLRARFRPDPRHGLIDLRTGIGRGPSDIHRDLLSFLNWVVREARAKIVATFDGDGNPISFGAVADDD